MFALITNLATAFAMSRPLGPRTLFQEIDGGQFYQNGSFFNMAMAMDHVHYGRGHACVCIDMYYFRLTCSIMYS